MGRRGRGGPRGSSRVPVEEILAPELLDQQRASHQLGCVSLYTHICVHVCVCSACMWVETLVCLRSEYANARGCEDVDVCAPTGVCVHTWRRETHTGTCTCTASMDSRVGDHVATHMHTHTHTRMIIFGYFHTHTHIHVHTELPQICTPTHPHTLTCVCCYFHTHTSVHTRAYKRGCA